MPDNIVSWLRTQLDIQQHWNEGTGLAAWLTYLDGHGRALPSRLVSAREFEPGRWQFDGHDAPEGWTHVNIVHDERVVRAEIAAKRAILNLHEHQRERGVVRGLNQRLAHVDPVPGLWRCLTCHPTEGSPPGRGWCETVRQLCRPYEHQPGYRPVWRP
jgi:Family of unknown function (DUF6221)